VPSGFEAGVRLTSSDVAEVRDILLVLIIAAENYSLNQDLVQFVNLLSFCKRICAFFHGCSEERYGRWREWGEGAGGAGGVALFNLPSLSAFSRSQR
jgi:hypothetical protein